MLMGINLLAVIKYAIAISVLVCVFLTPVYLAAVNEREKLDRMRVRCGVMLFGWSIIGWLVSLVIASKK
jgi:Mn2+/Fe2+ NRAMP family transporter